MAELLTTEQAISIEQVIQTAHSYHEAGMYKVAESLYQQIITTHANDPISVRNSAFYLARKGNRSAALQFLKMAMAAPTKYRIHFLDYAEIALSVGQTKQAEHVLRQLISIESSGPDVESLLERVLTTSLSKESQLTAAKADWAQGKLSDFRVKLSALFANSPLDPEILLLSAEHDFLTRNISIARQQIDRILQIEPDYEKAHELKKRVDEFAIGCYSDSYLAGCLSHRISHMDFPSTVNIETVGRCNANCTFCPHELLDRKLDVMADHVYEKIIKELSVIPPTSPLQLMFNVVNEPFMDRKIFQRFGLANQLIPHASINLNTNMNVRPPRFIENLRKVRNLEIFNVSFNAANEEDYIATMRIDFKRTVSNLKLLFKENRQSRFLFGPVCLSRIGSSDHRDYVFVEQCKELFSEFEYGLDYYAECRYRTNWLGSTDDIQTRIPYSMPCRQWFNISVLCTGVVAHCCMDSKGEFSFGSVKEKNILDIYNSPHFRHLRQSVTSREHVFPCNTCGLS